MTTNTTKFLQAYIICALWSSTDEYGTPLDDNYGPEDLSEQALQQFTEDCEAFYADNEADIALCRDVEYAGHDFWLTRNRHGAGFWDRGLGIIGQRLTEAAHTYGSCDVYVGDDGQLYVM